MRRTVSGTLYYYKILAPFFIPEVRTRNRKLTNDGHAIHKYCLYLLSLNKSSKNTNMEYFKSLKSVLGAPQDDQQPTAAETVRKFCTYFFAKGVVLV